MPVRGGKHYNQGRAFKKYIRERDNHTCQTCGGRVGEHGIRQMDVAHTVPFADCHETRPNNVRLLCHSCNQQERPRDRLTIDDWWAGLERALATV